MTGGAGFIGSHLIKRLLDMGHQVVCLDNFDNYYDISLKRANISPFIGNRNFWLFEGSITDDKMLDTCFDGIDYVFHIAAQAGVRESIINPMKTHEVNTTGTLKILNRSLKVNVKKLIFASSSSVYGTIKYLPIDEEHPKNPISPYGASKLCAENYCEIYSKIHGLDTVMLRYFTVFGPRMRPDLAISIFTHKSLADEDIKIFGDGSKSRDFTYIDNIIDANISAMTKGRGAYNVGGGIRTTIKDLAYGIIGLTGSKSKVIHDKDAVGDMEITLADISKANRELGYEPKINVTMGLKKYVEYVKNNTEYA